MEDKSVVAIVGIVALAAIEVVALFKGVNTGLLVATIGAIGAIVGGIGGFIVGKRQ